MANALKDILGFAGKAADGLLTGGQISGNKRRNQFSDYLNAGQYDEAEQLALRNGEGAYAQVAQQKGANAAAQAAAEQKRQQEQFKYIQNSAAFLDSLTPDLQKAYLDLNGPALVEQGVLDEDDLPILYQNVGVQGGFTGLARSAIDPNQQQQNVFEGQTIQETARSNRVGEGLRGREVSVSERNAATNEYRARNPQEMGIEVDADGGIRIGPGIAGKTAINEANKTISSNADSAEAGQNIITLLADAEALLAETDTGITAPLRQIGNQVAADLGDKDAEARASRFEQLEAIEKDLGIAALKFLGGSDTERELLTSIKTNIGRSKTNDANRQILKRKAAAAQVALERPGFDQRWVAENGSIAGLNSKGRAYQDAWREYQRTRFSAITSSGRPTQQNDQDVSELIKYMTPEERALFNGQ